jgi:hypothetical protein
MNGVISAYLQHSDAASAVEHEEIAIMRWPNAIVSNWHASWRDLYFCKEVAMLKIAVVVFALAVSGFMLWIAHEDANFAQLPHATFLKRAV